jgi:spermidine/putrescine transport system permease protein
MSEKPNATEERRGWLLLSPSALLLLGLLIVPLLLVLITSFGDRAANGTVLYGFSLNNYWRLLGFSGAQFDPLYLQIIARSGQLALLTTVLVIIIAYPLAYYVARAPEKQRNRLLFLILIPLWTNFVIRVYAWIMILRNQGVLNSVLGWLLGLVGVHYTPLDLYPSQGAVLIGLIYEFLPFMILPIYTSLEKIDESLFEAAADLGSNAFWTFLRITLPLSLPGMVAGTILVFIPTMGNFIVSDILGGRNVILVGNLIQRQFLDARDAPFGSAAAIFLMVLTLVVTVFYTRKFGFGDELAAG